MSQPIIQFGEEFELDLRAFELRRSGRPLRLERIPMEILILLVENRPGLVSREEIAARIWGKDVFVDTDNSINGAIRKIRRVLRDDPDNPRFIGTVTGKGYRFIAPVEGAPPRELPQAAHSGETPRGSTRRPGLMLGGLLLILAAGLAAGYVGWSRGPAGTPPAERRIMLAVLPFDNLTGDPGQDYFSDGLTEEMIGRLGNLAPRQLGVIARTSAMRYKQAGATLDALGRDLKVQYVLEGSVRRDGGRLRITAQLIEVEGQTHLWARQYDREPAGILAIQSEIAQAIADEIQLTFGEARMLPVQAAALSPRAVEAYDHYLKGRHYLNKRTREGFEQAIVEFQRAIARDPVDGRAHAGLADAYALLGTYGYAPQAEVMPRAREAALAALAIDERLAAAHTALALINEFHDRDWAAAEARFRRAQELDPNYVTAHHWYAELLGFQGRFEEALAAIDRARLLDPLSLIIATDRGAILHFARRHDEAIELFRMVLDLEPTFARAHLIVLAYAQQGAFEPALQEVRAWQEIEAGPWPLALAAHVLGQAGRQAEARQALASLEASLHRHKGDDPLPLRAMAYLGMGLHEEAMACLQQSCAESPASLVALKVDPLYDPLRDDPRFADLLGCAGLSP